MFTLRPPAEMAVRVERVIVRMGGETEVSPKHNVSRIRMTVALEYNDEICEEDVLVSCKQFLVDDAHFVNDTVHGVDHVDDDDDDDDVHGVEIHGMTRFLVSF